MNDLRVMLILFYQPEMIEKGIIPKDVKWDMLTKEQEKNVVNFITNKIEEQKIKKEIDNIC